LDTVQRKKVIVVIGTRPEAIKLAPVVLELQRHPQHFETQICVTGQHREMLDQVLHVFGLRPDRDLAVMKPGQDLTGVTAACLTGLDEVLRQERPDVVLVQGDTTTTFVAALAAYYHHIPVGHVEAGLRTGRKYDPFPEEINRRLSSHLYGFSLRSHRSGAEQSTCGRGQPEEHIGNWKHSYRCSFAHASALGRRTEPCGRLPGLD
jgi:UDP-N-acetylglucosamine 2-epimerase (non-hydrolysing)